MMQNSLGHSKRTTILFVEDESDFELLVGSYYMKRIDDGELDILYARNGAEALNVLEQRVDISVVVTDINMPEMDGLTLISILNERYPLIVPVILSAYGDMNNIRAALNRGAFDFITKPLDFDDMDMALENAVVEVRKRKQAIHEHDQFVALRRELEVATMIQHSLLPRDNSAVSDHRMYKIQAKMVPARNVGGDFYDFFAIDDEHVAIVIGDVCGKGIPAALFMAVSKTIIKATALRTPGPAECIRQANNLLARENIEDMFVTVFYGLLHIPTGTLRYCCGGHNLPYIKRRDGSITHVPSTNGLLLGITEEWDYTEQSLVLSPDEAIILYTDGVIDALDVNEEQFSEERLEVVLRESCTKNCDRVLHTIIDEVQRFSEGMQQMDDITILSLNYIGS